MRTSTHHKRGGRQCHGAAIRHAHSQLLVPERLAVPILGHKEVAGDEQQSRLCACTQRAPLGLEHAHQLLIGVLGSAHRPWRKHRLEEQSAQMCVCLCVSVLEGLSNLGTNEHSSAHVAASKHELSFSAGTNLVLRFQPTSMLACSHPYPELATCESGSCAQGPLTAPGASYPKLAILESGSHMRGSLDTCESGSHLLLATSDSGSCVQGPLDARDGADVLAIVRKLQGLLFEVQRECDLGEWHM
eukprot:1161423-Pelagomonas_calceolata.AAC.3